MNVLSKEDVEELLRMEKRFEDCAPIWFRSGYKEDRALVGEADNTIFNFDAAFGYNGHYKLKLQTRHHTIELVRLEVNAQPHTNPDGRKVGGNHIHVYDEVHGSKIAYEINPAQFPHPRDGARTFNDFCDYCNISEQHRPLARNDNIAS